MRRKEKGITLIALVVTIVVLLILAGITLGAVENRDGIINQAQETKEKAEIESVIEKIQSDLYKEKVKTGKVPNKAKLIEIINKQYGTVNGDSFTTNQGNYNIKLEEILGWEKPFSPGEVAIGSNKEYSDGTDTAIIPEGFTISDKEGESTISTGLVVYGPDNSEFVWVPVKDINSMAQCSTAGGSCNLQLQDGHLKCTTHNSEEIVGKLYATTTGEKFGTVNTTYNANSGLREPAYLIDKNYGDASSYNTIGLTLDGLKNDYKLMAESVAKNGGFYVGRYEMSLSTATNSSAGTSGTAQAKAGVIPTAANNSATNRWHGLYDKAKSYKASSVQSSMIWGSQYDAMLNWALDGADKDKVTTTGIGNNSSGSVTTTGNASYSNDSINHVRDLGGNLREWTLEASNTDYRVNRGGYSYGSLSPSCRNNSSPHSTSAYYGSRLTLYIK